ncbi:uncharacterized protein CCOS01_11600 [Colletotrichum costaricense]|uniref:Uncharacterized protein n=1 Tax=Colletotrichum costaricense TaxID=1209916 RepID=A0AAI9YPD2_9PEZI|nr:uncharacterized protein CCOS01_11600 [Colletotrichum costaricense]KAK1518780.1 hypothetical protein CCOS01_11600 [Colletotrichum costaricense]
MFPLKEGLVSLPAFGVYEVENRGTRAYLVPPPLSRRVSSQPIIVRYHKTPDDDKMKVSLAILTTLCASLATAGVVITPVRQNQVVPAAQKVSGDCFFGVVTPQGCA